MRSSDIDDTHVVHPDVVAGVKTLIAEQNAVVPDPDALPSDELGNEKIDPDVELEFWWNAVARDVHKTNVEKGFWDKPRNEGEILMLIVSELAEGLENIRHGKTPDDKIPQFKGIEAELADALIRIMDYGHGFGYDVIGALVAKRAYNKTRPFMHGKKF